MSLQQTTLTLPDNCLQSTHDRRLGEVYDIQLMQPSRNIGINYLLHKYKHLSNVILIYDSVDPIS